VSHIYSYSSDGCDVHDQEKLERFRELKTVWHELLHGDESHSLSGQFSDMMWQDAAWRTANEARRFADPDDPTAAIAPMLAAMLDRGYVSGQVIAISRLLEVSSPKNPKRGVVSLRRVVDEISQARDLFTREVFVSHDGLPYDWEAARRAESLPSGSAVRWMESKGPGAWVTAMGQHEVFDSLSRVSPDHRNREDRIADAVFDRLAAAFDDPVFADVLALRNKTVAHAADAFSRSQVKDLRKGLKLDEFAKAHYLLLGVMQVISSTLLYGHWIGATVPISQSNQFEHLQAAFVQPARLRDLVQFWHAHCSERDGWLSDAFYELLPERRR